jgi:hypothetical protein
MKIPITPLRYDCVLPEHEVPITETPGFEPEDRPAMRKLIEDGSLDMENLAEMNQDDLISVLRALTDDYGAWIQEQVLWIEQMYTL